MRGSGGLLCLVFFLKLNTLHDTLLLHIEVHHDETCDLIDTDDDPDEEQRCMEDVGGQSSQRNAEQPDSDHGDDHSRRRSVCG